VRYLSLFSGIEAASLAWLPLGWECVGVAEIDPFCCRLLSQRFPSVPNLGDVTAPDFIERARVLAPDLVVGGSPCQSFSVAGLGKSLSDSRGNLTLRFVEVVLGIDPDWVVWENVPGIFPKRDNPFGCFLAGLVGADAPLVPPTGSRWTNAGLVAGPKRTAAWRVLDAQWYGVAQRRSRVFVVSGRAGDFRCAEILLERPCMRRDPPTRGAKGQGVAADVAPCLGASGRGVERGGESRGQDPVVACFGGNNTGGAIDVATAQSAKGGTGRHDFESETFVAEKAPSLCAGGKAAESATQQDAESGALVASTTGKGFWSEGVSALRARSQESHEHLVCHSLGVDGFDASEDGTGRGTPLVPVSFDWQAGDGGTDKSFRGKSRSYIVDKPGRVRALTGSHVPAVAFQGSQTGCREYPEAGALRANGPGHDPVGTRVRDGMAVRRLTPREVERCFGMPDDWTLIEVRGKPAADGPRYKACGNSMAVPVVRWIGERIARAASDEGKVGG